MADQPVDVRSSIFQILRGKGLSPQQAMGVIYSMMGESTTALDSNAIGDSGRSIGWGQWNGSRRAALEATAAKMGVPWNDASAQLAHFKNEIDGPYAAEIENVKKNAVTAADATRLWTGSVGEKSGYERPAKNNWQQRFAQGAAAGKLAEDDTPVWSSSGTMVASHPVTGTDGTAPADTTTKPGPPTSVGDAIARLTKPDDKGKPSALGELASAFSPQQQQQGGGGGAPMLQPAADSSPMLAGPAQQLLSQTMASQRPLAWSMAPYGSGVAGPQIPNPSAPLQGGQWGSPGLTLNSLSPFGVG